jgi:hypothetical protein
MTEIKTSLVLLLSSTYFFLSNIFLQVPHEFDLFSVVDKISTMAILVYIAWSLNKKLETLTDKFRDEEERIRAASDKRIEDLMTKVFALYDEMIEKKQAN